MPKRRSINRERAESHPWSRARLSARFYPPAPGGARMAQPAAAPSVCRMANGKPMLILLAFAALALPATALALNLRAAPKIRSGKVHRMPSTTKSTGVPEIGPLYANVSATQHGCTASVVQSPGRNTLVTAAHCVLRSGRGMALPPVNAAGKHHMDAGSSRPPISSRNGWRARTRKPTSPSSPSLLGR